MQRYFEILEDTLLGFYLPSFGKSVYSDKEFKLSFLRVSENQEIDLIIEKGGSEIYACGIKGTRKADEQHVRTLQTLGSDIDGAKLRLISCDPTVKRFGEVTALP